MRDALGQRSIPHHVLNSTMATTRSRVVELSKHSPVQVFSFVIIGLVASVAIFTLVATPILEVFFENFLRSDVIRDGSAVVYRISENRQDEILMTSQYTTWALVDPSIQGNLPGVRVGEILVKPSYRAEYVFRPLVALAPLALVGGFVLAALLSALLSGSLGYLSQKIERETLVALDRLALAHFGHHTPHELQQLQRDIARADVRRLHDLADVYGVAYNDLELLQQALLWMEASGLNRVAKTLSAVKFYMREYFTDRYANTILGLVYMGAAVLIIVIGIRGLKFLPATDPSVVLSALALEFMLLITYAAVLMYGRAEEAPGLRVQASSSTASETQDSDSDTEQLLRALLAVQRSSDRTSSGDAS